MLHLVKTINFIIMRTPLVCGLLIAAVFALLPISAEAQCTNWDANGYIVLRQPGSKAMDITLVQKGKLITGTAVSIVKKSSGGGERRMAGTIDGTLDGDNFSVQIYWDNGQTGVYNGKVLLSGRLDGEAYEKRSPDIRLPWHTDGVLKCAPPAPVIPKPIRSSGKAKPAPPTPPFIIAGQAIIPTPNHPFGSVYLGWDGGPDYPNAEVWVSINNEAEIPAFSFDYPPQHPVFKQPKVTGIEMKFQRRTSYKLVLKAAGKTLSTAAFIVP